MEQQICTGCQQAMAPGVARWTLRERKGESWHFDCKEKAMRGELPDYFARLAGDPANQMTAEKWQEFEKELSGTYGHAALLCDGFLVNLSRTLIDANRLGIMVYVNGVFKGEWVGKEKPDCPEQRFLRRTERYVNSPKLRRDVLKILGKRAYAKSDYDRKLVLFVHYWTDAKSLRRHLLKTCKSIVLFPNFYVGD